MSNVAVKQACTTGLCCYSNNRPVLKHQTNTLKTYCVFLAEFKCSMFEKGLKTTSGGFSVFTMKGSLFVLLSVSVSMSNEMSVTFISPHGLKILSFPWTFPSMPTSKTDSSDENGVSLLCINGYLRRYKIFLFHFVLITLTMLTVDSRSLTIIVMYI